MELIGNDIGIMLIDDERDIVEAIGSLLEMNGFTNVHTFTKREDLLKALNKDIHICIVDYLLGTSKNGLDLIKEIAVQNQYCYFIMLSGQDDKRVVIDFMNSVFRSKYFEKGIDDVQDIVNVIRGVIRDINLINLIYSGIKKIDAQCQELKDYIEKPLNHNGNDVINLTG